MDFMPGFKTPTKDGAKSAVKTPDTEMDTDSFQGSPISQNCQALETIIEQLRRDNRRLTQELQDCLPKHGETPSTVLAIRHNNNHNEYQAYAWELVPYTTEHRSKRLPVFDAEGNQIGDSVNNSNKLVNEFNAEGDKKKRPRTGGKHSITRGKRGGNKKSCKRTKKR